ncbi:phospholipase D family protein [Rubritalea sp.]|uniref:phospholipase D family protein n=1 Tax=Rubritalea sp. TaxID=2109375 RepID=UPI003EF6DEF0
MKRLRTLIQLSQFLLYAIAVAGLSSCTTLPEVTHTEKVVTLKAPASSKLVEASRNVSNGSESHFLLLNEAMEAMLWRLALIDSAESSIDIQTFMWENDEAGALLFDRVLKAADRGVRVRLLVDDIWLESNEDGLAAIDAHPNLSIRLYNPLEVRGNALSRATHFLMNYEQLNQRMHNKTFIADGAFAINGGRNLGNKYFGLSDNYNFRDLDVISTGKVIRDISSEFDLFWNSAYAYPAEYLSNKADRFDVPASLNNMRKLLAKEEHHFLKSYPIHRQNWSKRLEKLPTLMQAGEAHFLGDDPYGRERIVVDYLTEAVSQAKQEIIIISPYFIPYANRFDGVKELIKRGVRVKIIVPSLGANNHTPTHSHYRKYRKAILDAGCELYEYNFQPSAEQRALCEVKPVTADFIGMHMKAVIVDRKTCFIGSLNMDPRAMDINTEEGLVIDSIALTSEMLDTVKTITAPGNAWKLEYDDQGKIVWKGGNGEVLTRQPARTNWQRVVDSIARWLPIESEL